MADNIVFKMTMKLDEDYNPAYVEGISVDNQAHFIVSRDAPFKVAKVLTYKSPAVGIDRVMKLIEAGMKKQMTLKKLKWS